MKAITGAVIALVCIAGLVVADYGYGGGYSYMPVYPGYGGNKGGYGEGGLLMLLGFLFLIMLLFGFNRTGTSSGTVTVVNATG